jgi:C4-dicarboxylate-specific signal transduction histidine kinase
MRPPATSAIADLTERMGKITGQLKLFAGKARQRRNAVRVRAALDHVLQLMAPRLGRDATGAGSTATPRTWPYGPTNSSSNRCC